VSTHPLISFVSETFGQQFADLVLAGYGTEPDSGPLRLHTTASDNEIQTRWIIELIADPIPSGDDPLVLAALLKLLLGCHHLSHILEFDLSELLRELEWPDNGGARSKVETAIKGYVQLLYDKQTHPSDDSDDDDDGGGFYHLLTGYFRGGRHGANGSNATSHSVCFDPSFVEGLKQGRVCFAGIDFGPLNYDG
jgi:hypothetical protein